MPVARRRRLGPASGPFLQLNPGLPGGLPRSAVWVATATARVPTANRIPGTSRTVFPWVPNLEKSISGARRCTKVHGGVLGSPGDPSLGWTAWPPDPVKSKTGQVLVKFRSSFSPAGRLGRLPIPGARRAGVTKGAKKCHPKLWRLSIAGFDARVLLPNRPVEGRLRTGSCPRAGSAKTSIQVIGSHEKSSWVILAGVAGGGQPREQPRIPDLLPMPHRRVLRTSHQGESLCNEPHPFPFTPH